MVVNYDSILTKNERPSVMVGIPAFNEEEMVGRIVAVAKTHSDFVVVVNDCSIDSTAKVAEDAGAYVISHSVNKGYGGGALTIFQTAQEYKPDILIFIDADGQHNPDDIPRFIAKIQEGYDVVVGSRFIDDGHKSKMPSYREFGIRMIDKATHIAANGAAPVSDILCGYRAFNPKAYSKIHSLNPSTHGCTEIIVKLGNLGMKFGEVPVVIRYDLEHTSKIGPIRMGVNLFGGIIQVMVTKRPLLCFGLPGIILLLFGIILAIQAFDVVAQTEIWPTLVTLVAGLLMVMGMLLITTAFILFAVAQMIQLVVSDKR